MFLAGLELDLDEFQRNRRPALTFGALTFTLPFVLGLLLVLPFGYGLATAALYGSLWASHTLVSYPIVQEHRLTRHRAVGMAAGGTVITDTLALFVLAVVVGSVESDDRSAVIVLSLVLGLVGARGLLRASCCPGSGAGRSRISERGATPRFLFLLAALTSAALVADRMGLEGIIGAFFAGLALNRLVPSGGELMESVELVGGVLLVPFFLLSTGMLLDPAQFTEPDVLVIAGASLAIVSRRQGDSVVPQRATLGLRRSPRSGSCSGSRRAGRGDARRGHDRHRGRHLRRGPAQRDARRRARDRDRRRASSRGSRRARSTRTPTRSGSLIMLTHSERVRDEVSSRSEGARL